MTRLEYLTAINKEFRLEMNALAANETFKALEHMDRVTKLCAELYERYGVKLVYDKETDEIKEAIL